MICRGCSIVWFDWEGCIGFEGMWIVLYWSRVDFGWIVVGIGYDSLFNWGYVLGYFGYL